MVAGRERDWERDSGPGPSGVPGGMSGACMRRMDLTMAAGLERGDGERGRDVDKDEMEQVLASVERYGARKSLGDES